MPEDPILEELWQIRREYAKEMNYSLRRMFEDLKEKEKKHQDRLVSFESKKLDKNTITE